MDILHTPTCAEKYSATLMHTKVPNKSTGNLLFLHTFHKHACKYTIRFCTAPFCTSFSYRKFIVSVCSASAFPVQQLLHSPNHLHLPMNFLPSLLDRNFLGGNNQPQMLGAWKNGGTHMSKSRLTGYLWFSSLSRNITRKKKKKWRNKMHAGFLLAVSDEMLLLRLLQPQTDEGHHLVCCLLCMKQTCLLMCVCA